ncbi:MAG: hypothetical protein CBD01_006910 [Euryarchaeota archaeon TMED141]|nr:MAG: hypothetical protein CBD01_006910 [Euryarchaeota archaeon TMED141]DAC09258.1 MAG TPA: hypothetical protein D7I09_06315 [Candidatus Poseidoniales archaeon]HII18925.1 hypothetical protein [Candidatus Poseidoniaceae archaeon]|tara:strand:- start:2184 stop:2993 length:810 start_codon:yes stop_codon:yes gene_type:complete
MPNSLRIAAQVVRAGPHHEVDAEGRLRPRKGGKGPGVVYLGNVATALIHGLQEAATLTMIRPPKFDEQRWELEVKAGDLTVRIHSRPYWGFGLFTKGYLNVLEFSGSEALRDRAVFDLAAALGRPPWAFAWPAASDRILKRLGFDRSAHAKAWKDGIQRGRDGLRDDIRTMEERRETVAKRLHAWLDDVGDEPTATHRQHRLIDADEDIEQSRKALNEDHAPGVERALARAEAALIEVDPLDDAPVGGQSEGVTSVLTVEDDLDVVDLT